MSYVQRKVKCIVPCMQVCNFLNVAAYIIGLGFLLQQLVTALQRQEATDRVSTAEDVSCFKRLPSMLYQVRRCN